MQRLLYAIGAGIALLVIVGLALPRESRVEVRAAAPPLNDASQESSTE